MNAKSISLMLLSIAALGLLLSQVIERGLLRVDKIEIVPAATSREPEQFNKIKVYLDQQLSFLKGEWVWSVRLSEVLGRVEKDRRVESARVVRVFPNQLRISVEARRPIMLILGPDESMYPVATDASLLLPVPLKEAPDLPVARGDKFLRDAGLRAQAVALLEEIPEKGAFSRSEISELHYSQREGFSLLLSREGLKVEVGDSGLGPKTSRVEQVLNYLQNQNLKARVIDARFNKKIVVRMRNEP